MSVNHTIIQGRLTKTVDLRSTTTGKSVASFTVAWSEKFGETEQKVFMPCVVWGKQAEFVSRYFTKGQECLVEGKLNGRKWQDKNGNNRETIELIVDRVHFCGPKNGNSGASQTGGFEEIPEDTEDTLPFN